MPDATADRRTDPRQPNIARVYDHILGGSLHNAHDRTFAADLAAAFPALTGIIRAQRCFQRRAVEWMLGNGVDQFIDLGSGLPTADHVHHVAGDARVVYVDMDSETVEDAGMILHSVPDAAAIRADIQQPGEILAHTETRRLIDTGRPVGILAIGILDFLPPPRTAIAPLTGLRNAFERDVYVAATLLTDQPPLDPDQLGLAAALLLRAIATPITARPPGTLRAWLGESGFQEAEYGSIPERQEEPLPAAETFIGRGGAIPPG